MAGLRGDDKLLGLSNIGAHLRVRPLSFWATLGGAVLPTRSSNAEFPLVENRVTSGFLRGCD